MLQTALGKKLLLLRVSKRRPLVKPYVPRIKQNVWIAVLQRA
jgi:hypothetical protein